MPTTASHMMIGHDISFSGSIWQSLSSTAGFQVPNLDTSCTISKIFLKLKDASGFESSAVERDASVACVRDITPENWSNRIGHGKVTFDGTNGIFYGGIRSQATDTSAAQSPAYSVDLTSGVFTALTQNNDIPLRQSHGLVYANSKLFVFGGCTPTQSSECLSGSKRLDSWDPATGNWTQQANTPADGVWGPAFVWTGSKLFAWGGVGSGWNGPHPASGALYDPGTDNWTTAATLGSPLGRIGTAAVWTGSKVLLYGGYPHAYTWGFYDPATDTWESGGVQDSSYPTWGRYMHGAVFNGSEMIIWGGSKISPPYKSSPHDLLYFNPTSKEFRIKAIGPGSTALSESASAVWANGKIFAYDHSNRKFYVIQTYEGL